MSAIEVLKKDIISYEEIRKSGKKCLTTNNEECCFVHYPEIKEALLALEQKEEMQMQIKRIEDCINEFETGGYFEENTLEEPSEFFIRDLKKVLNKMKEVLDRVGEQK